MSEQMTVQKPETEQLEVRPDAQIQNDMSVKDFLALLQENGLSKEAMNLTELLDNLNQAEQQFDAMHQRIQTLQDELDRIQGDTPLTDQFKKEMSTRADHVRGCVNDLADHFVATRDSIVESARQGIRNFVEKGRVALHQACAAMYQAGIKFFEASREVDHQTMDYHKTIRDHADKALQANKEMRQERANAFRRLVGMGPRETPIAVGSVHLEMLHNAATANVNLFSMSIHAKTKTLLKLQSRLEHHQEALKQRPSFDDRLNDAQKRAEFGSKNNIPKDRGLSGPAR